MSENIFFLCVKYIHSVANLLSTLAQSNATQHGSPAMNSTLTKVLFLTF